MRHCPVKPDVACSVTPEIALPLHSAQWPYGLEQRIQNRRGLGPADFSSGVSIAMRTGKPIPALRDALQGNRDAKIVIARGYAPAAMALVPSVFDKSFIFLLIADVKALRDHIAQVFGMYSLAALQMKLWVCKSHD